MSSVQVRVGYAREIELGITGTFEQRCLWIRQNLFFHDWQWIEQYDSVYYLEWESEDKMSAVEYVQSLDKFYLIQFLANNEDLFSYVMIDLKNKTKEEFFFAFMYYDGGTYFSSLFEEQLKKLKDKK